jgi:hypothetical protein
MWHYYQVIDAVKGEFEIVGEISNMNVVVPRIHEVP